jgi:hypothetical protein
MLHNLSFTIWMAGLLLVFLLLYVARAVLPTLERPWPFRRSGAPPPWHGGDHPFPLASANADHTPLVPPMGGQPVPLPPVPPRSAALMEYWAQQSAQPQDPPGAVRVADDAAHARPNPTPWENPVDDAAQRPPGSGRKGEVKYR